MGIRNVADLIEAARQRPEPVSVACAAPEDSESLEALRMAVDAGIARPLAVGRKEAIVTVARTLGISLDGVAFHHVSEPEAVAAVATGIVRDGDASILMKGHLPTKTIIRAVLDHRRGLRTERMLSHVALFDAVPLGKPVAVTDAAVNIRPSFSQKIEIVRNAGEVMQTLGVERPKVAALAAVEHVELPAMPATLDAKLIERMAGAGLLGNVDVQGPLALDGAISPEVVRAKELSGPVVGAADVLMAPDIETANVLYKGLTCFAGLEGAGIIWGARVPVVVPGRADTARMKFLSIALAVVLAEG